MASIFDAPPGTSPQQPRPRASGAGGLSAVERARQRRAARGGVSEIGQSVSQIADPVSQTADPVPQTVDPVSPQAKGGSAVERARARRAAVRTPTLEQSLEDQSSQGRTRQGIDPQNVMERLRSGVGRRPLVGADPQEEINRGARVAGEIDVGRVISGLAGPGENVSQAGVQDQGLRFALSRADIPAERAAALDARVGPDGWEIGADGSLQLTPVGQERVGHQGDGRNVTIDEPGLTFGDVSDVGADLPGIIGATAAGVATAGAGAIPAMAATAGGEALGSTIQEAIEQVIGENQETFGDVAGRVGTRAALAAGGEGVFRGARAGLNFARAPGASRMTPERAALRDEAVSEGFQVAPTAVTDQPLMGRFLNLSEQVLGSAREARNTELIKDRAKSLGASLGNARRNLQQVGDEVVAGVQGAATRFKAAAADNFALVDQLAGGEKFIPTARISKAAQDIRDSMAVRGDTGEVALGKSQLMKSLDDLINIEEFLSPSGLQHIRSQLGDGGLDSNVLLPNATQRQVSQLMNAAGESLTIDALQHSTNKKAVRALIDANKDYSEQIAKFDDSFVKSLVKDPSTIANWTPEQIMSRVFKPKNAGNVTNLSRILDEPTLKLVREAATEQLFTKFLRTNASDPFKLEISPKAFTDELIKFGRPTLNATFGKAHTDSMFRLARTAQLALKKPGQGGGLVAASVALSPVGNLSLLAKMNIFSKVMASPTGLKWFTDGIRFPKTERGIGALSRLSLLTATLARDHTTAEFGEQQGGQPAQVPQ